jgi:alginate O-acetyltransferase complex protein AlgI
MLFNSYEFIFVYLPVVFFGFFLIAPRNYRMAALWLAGASMFFYGWWNPKFVSLLFASILFNYSAGYLIGHSQVPRRSRCILFGAVTANLLLLAFFKYLNFFINVAGELGATVHHIDIVLPLGISFFTFTQLAFLVDVYRGIAREYNFIHYLLFVTWFPHLIAGPVLHHKQMMPQFDQSATYRIDTQSIAIGLTLFSLGLFKKVILADNLSLYANEVFDAAAEGGHPMLIEAWIGALAYSLQLYFDFSGYSDMAIGLSRIFNIKLPLNFNSPYKAASIIDFWRRWHMTLSVFLRDYLYVPLGGNRKGPWRRHINIMVTMLLGGLWHGAGWNFVLWGGLHGAYLLINHGWRNLTRHNIKTAGYFSGYAGVLLTFIAVVVAWVPFRATNFESAISMLEGMAGINGIPLSISFEPLLSPWLPQSVTFAELRCGTLSLGKAVNRTIAGLLIVWILPNTQQWLANFSPAWDTIKSSSSRFAWRPTPSFAILIGLLFAVSVLAFKKNSPFLYFQF